MPTPHEEEALDRKELQLHGRQLAVLQRDVGTVLAAQSTLGGKLDNIHQAILSAAPFWHNPAACPNVDRITSAEQRVTVVEHRVDRASGGGAVLYWLLGLLVAAGLVWLGSVLK
jgi:hypothetical protein